MPWICGGRCLRLLPARPPCAARRRLGRAGSRPCPSRRRPPRNEEETEEEKEMTRSVLVNHHSPLPFIIIINYYYLKKNPDHTSLKTCLAHGESLKRDVEPSPRPPCPKFLLPLPIND